ncbi:hypothetical protein [Lysobacter niastensis]|uniref:Uncharacterized protein n=1 Tax=Lysobacter niastensis TaxID=380629 RepID=A0ABS0BCR2_9GAMM|nr:hypothetical protein [Lysobacter niastensis]MBF6024915.1 hypothetical protein [Lysobacter niastensis]
MATTELARVRGSPLKERGILFLVLDSDERVAYASKALTPTPLEKLRHPLPEAGEPAPVVDGLLANGASAYVAKATTPFGWTVAVVQPASIVEVEEVAKRNHCCAYRGAAASQRRATLCEPY